MYRCFTRNYGVVEFKKIALIIGHNQYEQGAVNYLGESEFNFNKKVAEYVLERFRGGNVRVFEKEGYYRDKVIMFDPALIIELHFNSFGLKAYGCEAIVRYGSPSSKEEAGNLLNQFHKRFKIKSRGAKVASHSLQRGFRNFSRFETFSMFLFEPCFGNYQTKDSEKIMGNWIDYGDFLLDYCNWYCGFKKRVNKNIMDKMIGLIQSWFKRRK